jgi:hypothetical protein
MADEENKVVELPTRIRYNFEVQVISVEERFEEHRVNPHPDPADPSKTVYDVQKTSLGWFVRISDSSAMYFGMTKPDFGKGDTLEMTAMKKKVPA